jgi:hypothetical protein
MQAPGRGFDGCSAEREVTGRLVKIPIALHGAGLASSAGMPAAGLDLDGRAKGEARSRRPVDVKTPALKGAILEPGAGMCAAGSNFYSWSVEGNVPDRLGRLVVANDLVAVVAELAVDSVPPAPYGAAFEKGAGVQAAGSDLNGWSAEGTSPTDSGVSSSPTFSVLP